jgi:hypothetical protein
VISWAGEVAIDLAFLHARNGDMATAETLLDLLTTRDRSAGALTYALESGMVGPTGRNRRQLGEQTFTSFIRAAATDVIFTESPQIVRVISATGF